MLVEFIRMGIVYLHLIACCVAIGLVLTSDIAMVKQLLRADPTEKMNPIHLSELQRTVSRALLALWLTGALVIALDASLNGWSYFANPKLQSKVAIVLVLTINGFALHKYVLPMLQRNGSLLRLTVNQRTFALFAGAVSGVSWFYAAMLGIGRPLNYKYSLLQIMAAYPLLIAGGFAFMVLLTTWSQSKANGGVNSSLAGSH